MPFGTSHLYWITISYLKPSPLWYHDLVGLQEYIKILMQLLRECNNLISKHKYNQYWNWAMSCKWTKLKPRYRFMETLIKLKLIFKNWTESVKLHALRLWGTITRSYKIMCKMWLKCHCFFFKVKHNSWWCIKHQIIFCSARHKGRGKCETGKASTKIEVCWKIAWNHSY